MHPHPGCPPSSALGQVPLGWAVSLVPGFLGSPGAEGWLPKSLSVPSLQMREREVKLWDIRLFSGALASLTLDASPRYERLGCWDSRGGGLRAQMLSVIVRPGPQGRHPPMSHPGVFWRLGRGL